MIVSNPPYIKRDVIPTLDAEVKNYDPVLALDGGTDGLEFYRRIVELAPIGSSSPRAMSNGAFDLNSHSADNITRDATMPVAMNTSSIEPMILPSRFADSMAATAEAIEKKTRGTTRVNIMLMKTRPMGLSAAACSPATNPTIAPTTTPVRMSSGKR